MAQRLTALACLEMGLGAPGKGAGMPVEPPPAPLPLCMTTLLDPTMGLKDLVGLDVCPERESIALWLCEYGQQGGNDSSSSSSSSGSGSGRGGSGRASLTGRIVTRSLPMASLGSPEEGSSSAPLTLAAIGRLEWEACKARFLSLPSSYEELQDPAEAVGRFMSELLREKGERMEARVSDLGWGGECGQALLEDAQECKRGMEGYSIKMAQLRSAFQQRNALCLRLQEHVGAQCAWLEEKFAAREAQRQAQQARVDALTARAADLTLRLHTLFFSMAMLRAQKVDEAVRKRQYFPPKQLQAATWTEQAAFDKLHEILHKQVRPLFVEGAVGVVEQAKALVEHFARDKVEPEKFWEAKLDAIAEQVQAARANGV